MFSLLIAVFLAETPDGLAAWQKVHSVLTSPRCINCHTATNYPQQGDDRHRHFANVIRGPQDKGVVAFNCGTCHQSVNADSTGVPGGHNWHLAPLTMKWQDRNDQPLTSAEICRSILRQLDGTHIVKHHEEEPLVLWAWKPGRSDEYTLARHDDAFNKYIQTEPRPSPATAVNDFVLGTSDIAAAR